MLENKSPHSVFFVSGPVAMVTNSVWNDNIDPVCEEVNLHGFSPSNDNLGSVTGEASGQGHNVSCHTE